MNRNVVHWRHVVVTVIAGALLVALLLPSGLLQAQDDVIQFETGHSLSNEYGFLSFWREHQGDQLFGAAISAPTEVDGLVVQYFERARFELHRELEGSPILLGRLGAEYTTALWREFDPPTSEALEDSNGQFFIETGHTLREPFRSFWHLNGGVNLLGLPISEPRWEYISDKMVEVQYFERVRLERHPQLSGTDSIVISSLGRDMALFNGVVLEAPATPTPEPTLVPTVQPTQAPVAAAPAAAKPVANPVTKQEEPAPKARAGNSGGKSIIVDLSEQHLYAYEGDTLVFDTPVSTGRDGFNTPPGTFSVYAKLRIQDMKGTIGGESYYVPDVPHVMYINGGVAIHGTYWHNQFGIRRMSHGCINAPLAAAEWLYKWAPVGTTTIVRW